MKQNEVAGCSKQGSEEFLSVLWVISPYKIWLEISIQLINNLSSFLIIQITYFFQLYLEGTLYFHCMTLCGPYHPQCVISDSFLSYIVF